MDLKILVIGFLTLSVLFGCTEDWKPQDNQTNASLDDSALKKFATEAELEAFLKDNRYDDYRQISIAMPLMADGTAVKASAESGSASDSASDYSTTNVQVAGVDEADFVKSDGRYLYVLTGDKLVIIDAYPAEDAEIVSETTIEGTPSEFYVDGDDLVVFTQGTPDAIPLAKPGSSYYYYGGGYTGILQYDISDRTDPELERDIYAQGWYFDSRMIDRHVYAIVNKDAWYSEEDGVEPPMLYVDGKNASAEFPDIYYPDVPAYSYRYSTVLSMDLDETDDEPERKIYLMGASSEMYVSQDNIYLVHERYPYMPRPVPLIGDVVDAVMPGMIEPYAYKEETAIHRIEIDDGDIGYQASGSVPGHVLNQFSMDEYDGYFRIATTEGQVARTSAQATSRNNVYVLDMDMEVVGELEDLAPGERIYSARFMGKRGYLVTFRKVDPLFVIDLKDPKDPEVLGKLKIPGYSDYLHPYDENHLIGLGKEAIPSESGDFSWYQGVKLSLFDVSDVSKPKEISKYEIGDRGTESYALQDHKAFLFSKSKNLLVIPVLEAEIDEEQYPQGLDPWQYGDYVFQGAYVFDIDTEDGFSLKGKVSHVDSGTLKKSGYYFYSPYSVKRSLYMDDTLYTISDSLVKMNDLDDLDEINEVELPYEESNGWYYYE